MNHHRNADLGLQTRFFWEKNDCAHYKDCIIPSIKVCERVWNVYNVHLSDGK